MHDCYKILKDIFAAAQLNPPPRDLVHISGNDPILPSNFLIGTAGASVIAATGVAAANLWRLRTGQKQVVSIDLRRAAMAMRSDRFVYCNDKKIAGWDPVSGFYQANDGRWVQLHCNYRHHRERTLELLEAEENRDSIASKVSKWNSFELEFALTNFDSICAVVRSSMEWSEHLHSVAVDSLPLFEIIKIGEADAVPLPDGTRPLSGIRVVDLTRVIAGPMCGRTLAEHGAEVLRINRPGFPCATALTIDTGFGKLEAEVDIGTKEGGETLRKLTKNGDVFVQGYRPDSISRKGFSPEEVSELKPGIVYVSLSAFGHEGPWGYKRGFDSIVQSCSGIAYEQSEGLGGSPIHLPAQCLDYLTGYLAAFGVMEALRRRAIEGGSWLVRISLIQTANWFKNLGRVSIEKDARNLRDSVIEDILDLTMETDTPFGLVRHLAPAITLSKTPSKWITPVVPQSSDMPSWIRGVP